METGLPSEDTTRPRGKPTKRYTVNDVSEKTFQRRRVKSEPPKRNPMSVNTEGEQQKRSKSKNPSSTPPEKKTRKTKEELLKIQEAEDREDKRDARMDAKIVKGMKKAYATGIEPKNVRVNHGVDLIDNKSRSFWGRQNITVIKQQAELRGKRFSDQETKGGNNNVNGVITKFNKFKKEDYLK